MKAYTFNNGILLINNFLSKEFIPRSGMSYPCDFKFDLKPTNDNSFREWVGDEVFKELSANIWRALVNGQEVTIDKLLLLAWESITNINLFNKNKCKKRINATINYKYTKLNYENALCELIRWSANNGEYGTIV